MFTQRTLIKKVRVARTENRREKIVAAAASLFMDRGYEASSVREISREAGVTEAALYYHFEGKRDLLREVVRTHLPDLESALGYCRGANSLGELLERLGRALGSPDTARMARFRWVTTDFPRLGEEERALLREKHLALQEGLAELARPFARDDREARDLSWTLLCAAFGYALVFWTLEMADDPAFDHERLAGLLGDALSARASLETTEEGS